MNIFCRLGQHRASALLNETREYDRKVTDHGETIDSKERKECSCGVIIEIETHSVSYSRKTVSEPPAVAGGQT
jgi:hypothetical protein